jgi:hypothetical protein
MKGMEDGIALTDLKIEQDSTSLATQRGVKPLYITIEQRHALTGIRSLRVITIDTSRKGI